MRRTLRNLLAAAALVATGNAGAASIGYALAVVDVGAPSAFAFLFFTPIAPQGAQASWTFSGNIVLTDATGDGVSASISGLPEFWQLAVTDASSAVHVVDDVGGTAALVGAGTFNFVVSGTFDCSALTGGCAGMQIGINFGLSGGGDGLGSTATFQLNPVVVPEPATLLLLGLALAGFAAARRASPMRALR